MNRVPVELQNEMNRQVLTHVEPLSCHSDIIEPINSSANRHSDVRSFCPDGKSYKYCIWYVGRTIFAFATGMQNIGLRLPTQSHDEALSGGATQCMAAGDMWMSFPYNDEQMDKWVEMAYEYAKTPQPSVTEES